MRKEQWPNLICKEMLADEIMREGLQSYGEDANLEEASLEVSKGEQILINENNEEWEISKPTTKREGVKKKGPIISKRKSSRKR